METRSDVRLPPGWVVQGIRNPAVGGVLCLIRHDGAQSRMARGTPRFLRAPRASILWFARYTAEIVSNGWEPYDQAVPAMYMPHAYSAFELMRGNKTSPVLLLQRKPDRGRARIALIEPGAHGLLKFLPVQESEHLSWTLAEALAFIGVPPKYLDEASAKLLERNCLKAATAS